MKRFTYPLIYLSICCSLLALTACSQNLGLAVNQHNIDFGIDPVPLGFTFDIDQETGVVTFEIPQHELIFSSKRGALGATVEGYRIVFKDASGADLFSGDSEVNSLGALNVYVPPGSICDEPDPVRGCTFDDAGHRFAPGPQVRSPSGAFLPLDIASSDFELIGKGGAVGAYGDVFLLGTNDAGVTFSAGPYRVAIQVPLGG